MKTIGIIGGMSWESTVIYYQELNKAVKHIEGGFHSAKVIINSIDFAEIEVLQRLGRWDEAATILCDAAKSLEKAGADLLLIAANTMHIVADQVEEAVNIPLIHIVDATGQKLVEQGISKIGLLGTAFTMEQAFYKQRLTDKFGIEVIVPNGVQRRLVHDVIYDELCLGKINQTSKQDYRAIIDDLVENGAQGVILGCTEIGMLIQQEDTDVALFDTAQLHVEAAIREAFK